jgi:hypothetical protein
MVGGYEFGGKSKAKYSFNAGLNEASMYVVAAGIEFIGIPSEQLIKQEIHFAVFRHM